MNLSGPTTDRSSPTTGRQRLRLELFGGPTLWRGEHPIGISPLQSGLLAIAFAQGGNRVPRRAVQRLLWDRHDDRVVRHRVSQLVYQTNRRCEARIIKLAGEHVRIQGEFVDCDREDFEGMIRVRNLREACDLLNRGFLATLSGRRTAAFADWIDDRRMSVRARLREAALVSWEQAEAVQDWATARHAAETLLRLDPRDEALLRRVMRARAMGGMVREAEALYRSFAERANPSGAWNPEPETWKLFETVRSSYGRMRTHNPAEPEPKAPFLGRYDELAQLTRAIHRLDGDWRSVMISGEEGVGKTRLVEEAIRGARLRGYRIMRACPGELERNIPLNPLLEGLDRSWVGPFVDTLEEPWRATLLPLLPQFRLGSEPPQEGPCAHPESLPRRTCEAFFHLFDAIAGSERAVLFVDNFQWADKMSVSVLQFLRRRWRTGKFTLLLAYRNEALPADDPVSQFIRQTETDPRVTSIHLRSLDPQSAKKLAGSLCSERLAEGMLDKIVEMAGGNPFLLVELAADSSADASGQSASEIPIPQAVRRVIGRRMAELDTNARKLISGLAVFGLPAALERVVRISGGDREACVSALERLGERRLVEWGNEGVRIRNDIVRRTVYEDLSAARRAMLHKTMAELYSESGEPPLERVALHYHRAGEGKLARACALEAMESPEPGGATDRLQLLRTAYEVVEKPRHDLPSAQLAEAHYEARQLAEAQRFGEIATQTQESMSSGESARIRLIVAESRRLLGIDDPQVTLGKLGRIGDAARRRGQEGILTRVLDTTCQVLDGLGATKELAELLSGMGEPERFRNPGARCRALGALVLGSLGGSPEAGLHSGHQAAEIAWKGKLSGVRMMTLQRHILALAMAGKLATQEGRRSIRRAKARSSRTKDHFSSALILFELTNWHSSLGSRETAAGILAEFRTLAEPMDCPLVRFLEGLARGSVALVRRDLGKVEEAFRQAREYAGVTIAPRYLHALSGLEGSLLLERGKLRQAAKVAERHLHPSDESAANVPPNWVLFHARLRSRKGDAGGALDVLEAGVAKTDPARAADWLRLALGLVRLARRRGCPRKDLAREAQARARELCLPGMAHEFVPFVN